MINQLNQSLTVSRMGYQRDIESTVHMRLYTMTKKQFVVLSLMFASVLIISCLSSLPAPTVLTRITNYGRDLAKSDQLATGPFHINSEPVLLYQKELWLSAVIHRKLPTAGISIPIQTTVLITCYVQQTPNTTSVIEKEEASKSEVSLWTEKYTRKSTLNCVTEGCDEIPLVHLPVLVCNRYMFTVKFNGISSETNEMKTSPEVVEVEFISQTYNSIFTYFELFSRFLAFLSVFGLLTAFIVSMFPFERKNWTIEQLWTSILLFFLLFFYNPFHPMIFLLKGILPQVTDYLFQSIFVSALFFYWLSVYHAYRVSTRSLCKFYLPKVMLIGVMWLLYCTYTIYYVDAEYKDPLFVWSTASQKTFLIVFASLFGIFSFVYLLYFLIMLIRTYSELRGLAYFDIRLRFLTIPIILVVIGGFVVWFSRFNLVFPPSYKPVTTELFGVVKEEFFTPSHIPQTMFRSSFELAFIFGLLFAYMLINVIAYGPAKTALAEANFKDYPTVSMFHDSDEDVLYGSDTEDLKMHSLRHR